MAFVAQLAERLTCNQEVWSSILHGGIFLPGRGAGRRRRANAPIIRAIGAWGARFAQNFTKTEMVRLLFISLFALLDRCRDSLITTPNTPVKRFVLVRPPGGCAAGNSPSNLPQIVRPVRGSSPEMANDGRRDVVRPRTDRRTPSPGHDTATVFVGGLNFATDDRMLRGVCEACGDVSSVKVMYDAESGRSRGFAFVTFANAKDARNAVDALDGQNVDGRKVRCNLAPDKTQRHDDRHSDRKTQFNGHDRRDKRDAKNSERDGRDKFNKKYATDVEVAGKRRRLGEGENTHQRQETHTKNRRGVSDANSDSDSDSDAIIANAQIAALESLLLKEKKRAYAAEAALAKLSCSFLEIRKTLAKQLDECEKTVMNTAVRAFEHVMNQFQQKMRSNVEAALDEAGKELKESTR